MKLKTEHIIIAGILAILFGLYLAFVMQWYIVGVCFIALGGCLGVCAEVADAIGNISIGWEPKPDRRMDAYDDDADDDPRA